MAEALEQMILPAVNRHLVDTGERAEQVISQLMVSMVREGQVAVDCEWGANAAHEGASLLQLATRGLVVLVDLLALPTTPAVHKLLADVADLAFASRHVVVLGFDGEANDLPHLRAAWRRRGLVFPARVTRYVDVRVACARAGGWEADYDELRGYGLADCAAKFLGRRLDKSPRDLDWRRRPLTEAAVAYAALDAYALLQLYDRPEVASAVERASASCPAPRRRGPRGARSVAWSPTASSFQSPQSDSDAEDARRAEFYGALRDWLEKDVLDRAAKGCSTLDGYEHALNVGKNRPLPCPLRPHSYGTLRVVRACRCRGGNRSFDGSSFEDKLLRSGPLRARARAASDPGHALLFNWLKARYGSTALRALPPLPTADDDGDDDDEAAGEAAARARRAAVGAARLVHATSTFLARWPAEVPRACAPKAACDVFPSTALRDAAALVGAYRERHAPVGDCWVVDQSLELGGDGLAAHASLRPAERYPCQGEALHEAMLRVLRNHTPAAIVVDELVDRAAALAAADVGKRGVQLLASAHAWEKGATSAHARSLAELVDDAALAPVLGDFEIVTLSDREAARRAKTQRDPRKVRRQRVRNATFGCVVELRPRSPGRPGEWSVVLDVNAAVDAIVENGAYDAQARFYDAAHDLSAEPRVLGGLE
ncbi:endoplasmic reticulum-plasma membrane tethering protein [Aureococcus anophagefferens]|uniref:Endoplasmic reticulum-plasma membrane tethering protein n=1 Tax=Aureococcus anophagefferens TaxID=44056 RepID=A0ABR1FVX8_AURAN